MPIRINDSRDKGKQPSADPPPPRGATWIGVRVARWLGADDPDHVLTPALLDDALEHDWVTTWEWQFCRDLWDRHRRFTPKQRAKLCEINAKIFARIRGCSP
jgi:hypothetical protein